MKFKTKTSIYDLTKLGDGTYNLEKVGLLPGAESSVEVGTKHNGLPTFLANRLFLSKTDGSGLMNTTHIVEEDRIPLKCFITGQNN
jgi:hypothetical protein